MFFLFSVIPGESRAQQVYSLSEKITVNVVNSNLAAVLEEIGKQTNYHFTYVKASLEKTPVAEFKVTDVTLKTALDLLCKKVPLEYTVTNAVIAFRLKVSAPSKTAPSLSRHPVSGRVTDARNGNGLAGVNVNVEGTGAGSITDADGKFSILADSGAILTVSFVGYATKMVPAGDKTQLSISLRQDPKTLGGVTVEARRRLNTEASLLTERRNSAVVSDAISAQQIEKTASITTTQALQRVTGVTITDDKYVAIRGLGDRSVIAELNGVRLSSSNPDRSAVPLDLVPAALLDNVTVYKTLTPDRPADASAGIVELKTKSIPAKLTVSFTAEGGFNSTIGLTGEFNSFQNANPGYFGQKVSQRDLSQSFLGLTKQYPGGLQQIQELFLESRSSQAKTAEALRINNIMWGFDPVLTTSYQRAQPNRLFSASIGNTFKIFHGHDLGVVISANYYHRTEDRYQADLNRWSIEQGVVTGSSLVYSPLHVPSFSNPDAIYLGKYLSYKENTGTETLNYGGLIGLTYRFDALNEINAQYLGSRGAEEQGKNLTGSYQNTGLSYPVYDQVNVLQQSYRVFNTFNLQGIHKLFNHPLAPKITYNLSNSKSSQDDPDYRFTDIADAHTVTSLDANGVGQGKDTYVFDVGAVHGVGPTGVIQADPNGRQYRKLTENNHNYKADLTESFTVFGLNQDLKFGYNYLKRDRNYTENELGIPGTLAGGDNGLLQKVNGDLNALVSSKYIGLQQSSESIGAPRVGGFLYQIYKTPNNYQGFYKTEAFYGMLDAHLSPRLRVTGGVRFESTNIQALVDTSKVFAGTALASVQQTQSNGNSITAPYTAYQVGFKPFYSANLTYGLRADMNLRLAYATSLARPELREITNIYEFDPYQFAVVIGNPALVNQFTKSADMRWEWFPSAGEVISASVFGKYIQHQLTKTFSYTAQGDLATNPEYPVVRFENDPEPGKVAGVELELRKNLGKIWSPLDHFFLGTNLLFAYSEVKKNPARLDADRTMDRFSPAKSPLFEQAPYVINAYIDYDNPRLGTDITLSFNEVGERLVQVQLDGTPDLFDRPVPVLDAVFSQRLGKRFVLKGFAKNILNPPYRTVYTIAGNGGTYRGHTYINHQYYRGTEVALGLTYNLF